MRKGEMISLIGMGFNGIIIKVILIQFCIPK
jgi:hypothetical protein